MSLPSGFFPSVFPTKTLNACLLFHAYRVPMSSLPCLPCAHVFCSMLTVCPFLLFHAYRVPMSSLPCLPCAHSFSSMLTVCPFLLFHIDFIFLIIFG
jgi:hypothetical protein